MSFALEFALQWLEVVDFTVVGDGNGVILVVEWLLTTLQVYDRKSPVSESDPWLLVVTFPIRTPMYQRPSHTPQDSRIGVTGSLKIENSGDSAHTC
jgi:hypothetical protein